MRKNGIYDNWKYRKNFQKYGGKDIRDSNQTRIAASIAEKQNNLANNGNPNNFNKGLQWFDSGLSLEDAPEEMRTDASFIGGFDRGKRLKVINQQVYDLGVEFFMKGISFEDVPKNYKTNEYFIAGYNDAMKKRNSKSL